MLKVRDPSERDHGGVIGGVFSDTRVLLVIEMKYEEPLWKMPGGAKKKRETRNQACAREVREETGVNIHPRRFQHTHTERSGKEVCFAFVKDSHLDKCKPGKDGEVPRVFTFEEAFALNLHPRHKKHVKHMQRLAALK